MLPTNEISKLNFHFLMCCSKRKHKWKIRKNLESCTWDQRLKWVNRISQTENCEKKGNWAYRRYSKNLKESYEKYRDIELVFALRCLCRERFPHINSSNYPEFFWCSYNDVKLKYKNDSWKTFTWIWFDDNENIWQQGIHRGNSKSLRLSEIIWINGILSHMNKYR